MLEVLYGTGMRISELTGLSLSDLAVEDQLVRVFGKGSKERLVPVGRYARQALGAWIGPGGRPALVPEGGHGAATPTPSSSTCGVGGSAARERGG